MSDVSLSNHKMVRAPRVSVRSTLAGRARQRVRGARAE